MDGKPLVINGRTYIELADTAHYATDPHVTNLVLDMGRLPYVGLQLAPRAPVFQFNYAYHTFGKEAFELHDELRGPGGDVKTTDLTKTRATGALAHRALAVPYDKVYDGSIHGAQPTLNDAWRRSKAAAARLIMEMMLEYRIASLLALYTNWASTNRATPTHKWGAGSDTPISDLDTALDTVEDVAGVRPNVLCFASAPWRKFRRHADVKGWVVYANPEAARNARVTAANVAAMFEVETVVVGAAQYYDPITAANVKMWGDTVITAYRSPVPDVNTPAAAYTFTLDGNPTAITWAEERKFSEFSGWADAYEVKLVGNTFGYIIYGVTA